MTDEYGTPTPPAATRINMRLFGRTAKRNIRRHPQLGVKLARARNPLVPWAYLANVYGFAIGAAIFGTLPFIAALLTGSLATLGVVVALSLLVLPGMAAAMMYSYMMLKPELIINGRKQDIEANMPYALNFLAALSSAGVVAEQVFGALGQQEVYGEVSRESAWIHRDTAMFSKDLVGAIQDGARRSPSVQWEEFLHGSVNTITSGGDLRSYFLAKAEQYAHENRRRQRAFLESMGVMAESYVVVAAAAPLFMIVILSIMMLLSNQGNPVFLLNMLVLVGLPLTHGAFTAILRSMRAR